MFISRDVLSCKKTVVLNPTCGNSICWDSLSGGQSTRLMDCSDIHAHTHARHMLGIAMPYSAAPPHGLTRETKYWTKTVGYENTGNTTSERQRTHSTESKCIFCVLKHMCRIPAVQYLQNLSEFSGASPFPVVETTMTTVFHSFSSGFICAKQSRSICNTQ